MTNRMRLSFERNGVCRLRASRIAHGGSWKGEAEERRVVTTAVELGIPMPAIGAALAYYDGYRSERLPANLLQAQRDYFGAHTYERIDRPRGEFFPKQWI